MLRGAVIDPVADSHAEGEEELEETAELATNFLGRHFGRVHGDDDGRNAYCSEVAVRIELRIS